MGHPFVVSEAQPRGALSRKPNPHRHTRRLVTAGHDEARTGVP